MMETSIETSRRGPTVSTISTQKTKLRKTNLYLTEEIIQELHAISKETGVPASELVRRALRASFAEFKEQQRWNAIAARERADAQLKKERKRKKEY